MSGKYPVGGWQGWQGFALWKDKVDNELVEIRARIDAIAVALNASTPDSKTGQSGGPTGGSGSGGPKADSSSSEFGKGSDFSSVESYTKNMDAAKSLGELYDKMGNMEGDDTESNSLDNLISATYAFHSATHAMRGYLMLVDQLGLSKDQKKMVRDLEYVMMAIMKLTMAISMIGEMMAGTLQPEFLPIFLVGGLMSASVGYSYKVVGSGV